MMPTEWSTQTSLVWLVRRCWQRSIAALPQSRRSRHWSTCSRSSSGMYSRNLCPMSAWDEVPSSSHRAGFTCTIRSWESVTAMPSGAPSMAIRNCSSLRASSRLARSSSVTSRMAIAVRRPVPASATGRAVTDM